MHSVSKDDYAAYRLARQAYAAVCSRAKEAGGIAVAAGPPHLAILRRRLNPRTAPNRAFPGIGGRDGPGYFADDFERLLRCSDVREIVVDDSADRITVYTGPIYRLARGRRFEIGDFAISIIAGRGFEVRNVRNTGRDPTRDHPLVSGGTCCLGNIGPMVASALGRGEIAAAAILLLLYLKEAVLPDDPALLANWKEVT